MQYVGSDVSQLSRVLKYNFNGQPNQDQDNAIPRDIQPGAALFHCRLV